MPSPPPSHETLAPYALHASVTGCPTAYLSVRSASPATITPELSTSQTQIRQLEVPTAVRRTPSASVAVSLVSPLKSPHALAGAATAGAAALCDWSPVITLQA